MALSQIEFEFDESSSKKKDEKKSSVVEELLQKKGKRGRKSLKEMGLNVNLIEVPHDDELFQKQYYSIGDVAIMFRENTSLIRYWANEFSIFLKPRKNKKGDRYFRPEDVKNLKMIYHLLRERKYTIDGAKEFLRNNKAAGEKHEMIEALQRIKLFLTELKNNL